DRVRRGAVPLRWGRPAAFSRCRGRAPGSTTWPYRHLVLPCARRRHRPPWGEPGRGWVSRAAIARAGREPGGRRASRTAIAGAGSGPGSRARAGGPGPGSRGRRVGEEWRGSRGMWRRRAAARPGLPGSSREGKALLGGCSKSGRSPIARVRSLGIMVPAVPARPLLLRPREGGARVPELQARPTGPGPKLQNVRRAACQRQETGGPVKKTPWIIGAATVCVVAIGGGGTAFAMSNEAQITVYGEQSSVRTFAQPTVADLLADQGIEVEETDLVVPGLDTVVSDGMDIQVVQRTPVTVSVDGTAQEILTTGDTVADALEEADYDAEGAAVTPAPETTLAEAEGDVEVITRKTVTFVGQYGQDTFEVNALTVGEAMEKVLGDIEDTDTADVPRDTLLEDGATHTVERVREKERTETE